MKYKPRYEMDRFTNCAIYASYQKYYCSDRCLGKRSNWVDHITKIYYIETITPDLRSTKRKIWVNKI